MRQDAETANGPVVPFFLAAFALAATNVSFLAENLLVYSSKGREKEANVASRTNPMETGLKELLLSGKA